jgi:hypothetical protein
VILRVLVGLRTGSTSGLSPINSSNLKLSTALRHVHRLPDLHAVSDAPGIKPRTDRQPTTL